MILNKVVARFRDGRLLKGKTPDFVPKNKYFHLETPDGHTTTVHMNQLKAVFFVKDSKGNKNHQADYDNVVPGGGMKIKVTFFDGEIVIGYSLSYFSNPYGFFMTPSDLKGNNERIFVVKSAVDNVEIIENSKIKEGVRQR
jgi:hypothetical protein